MVMPLALLYRHLTRPLFTWIGWCEQKSRYQSVCVHGLPVHCDIQSIVVLHSGEAGVRKGREQSFSSSKVNRMDGWAHTIQMV